MQTEFLQLKGGKRMSGKNNAEWSGISEFQLYLFNEGTNFRSYEMLGAHKVENGWRFAVWAPNADRVCLAGDFNGWNNFNKPLEKIGSTGVWYGVFDDIKEGDLYKYAIFDKNRNVVLKSDPFAFYSELRPDTASIVRDISNFKWEDAKWLRKRKATAPYDKPMLIYEMHIGSWKQHDDGSFYNYRELAEDLIPYIVDMGYTHIEIRKDLFGRDRMICCKRLPK